MDRLLRAEIVSEVKRSMNEILEVANERWITGEELCDTFQMFTPSWLKTYGKFLPRTRAEVTEDGKVASSRWAYPKHRIARMIANNEIKNLGLSD